jgi:C4-dicarboxylate-specific signal transduction histidine kinase
MIGITFDITARKEAEAHVITLLTQAEQREQDLREKQAQLVQAAKLASIGELATGVAHEINNPLNNISLCADNLIDAIRSGLANDEILLSELQLITAQVQKAALIVDHLRRFGRAAPQRRTAIHVHQVVRSALSLMREQLRLRNIEVKTHWASEDPQVEGNALQIEQVLLNLLTNARDAVSFTDAKMITLATAVDKDWVSIRVMDTGIGMSEDVKKRIFDPFFTTKEVGKGTGLGLSLSYGIIHDHQGMLTVESQPGQGTTFMVQLPSPAVDTA